MRIDLFFVEKLFLIAAVKYNLIIKTL